MVEQAINSILSAVIGGLVASVYNRFIQFITYHRERHESHMHALLIANEEFFQIIAMNKYDDELIDKIKKHLRDIGKIDSFQCIIPIAECYYDYPLSNNFEFNILDYELVNDITIARTKVNSYRSRFKSSLNAIYKLNDLLSKYYYEDNNTEQLLNDIKLNSNIMIRNLDEIKKDCELTLSVCERIHKKAEDLYNTDTLHLFDYIIKGKTQKASKIKGEDINKLKNKTKWFH